jgi:hypothetical protein
MAMIDRLTAETQQRLAYLIIGGYFLLKILEGLHWIQAVRGPDELAMLAAAYFFMRQRNQEKPSA